MLTEALITFGLFLTRIIFRVDLRKSLDAAMQESDPAEFDTPYRLLGNIARAVGGAMAWIAGVVITVLPWSVFGTVFRTTHPALSSAIADLGSGVVAFAMAGFCLYLLRMGLVVSLAQRETKRALRRVEVARSGQGGPSIASPSPLVHLALVVTRGSDLDLVLQAAAGVLVAIALVNYAHTRGYPL